MDIGILAPILLKKYGSPLYVYDETLLRERCREIKSLSSSPLYTPVYSAKANTNVELLKIIHEEGFYADAMSIGEIICEEAAGFNYEEIFFVSNNVSVDEMREAARRKILFSADSVSQLEQYGKANFSPRIAFRYNPGIGAGHSAKVVTGGKSKFGIEKKDLPLVLDCAARYGLTIIGINQHIGSLFLESGAYFAAAEALCEIAPQFPSLEFIDFGGGLGVPYNHESRLDLADFSIKLEKLMNEFNEKRKKNNRTVLKLQFQNKSNIRFFVETGRYISAECGVLLGTVHSVKNNSGDYYAGTDLGFNVLMRPILYNAYHEIQFLPQNSAAFNSRPRMPLIVTGNICESGDILARIESPLPDTGDNIAVFNAGAYGYSMASNYNCRPRPAEVLIKTDGTEKLIRERDKYEDMI